METNKLTKLLKLSPLLLVLQLPALTLPAQAKLPPSLNFSPVGENSPESSTGEKKETISLLFAVKVSTADRMKAMTDVSSLTEKIARIQEHTMTLPESEASKLTPARREILEKTLMQAQARRLAICFDRRGTNRALIGDRTKAMSDIDEAVASDHTYAPAFNNRAWMKAQGGDLDGAMDDVNKAIELMPDMAEAFDTRGTIYLARKKYDLALADYNSSISIKPLYAEAYYHRALLHKTLGETREYEADTKKAIELNFPVDSVDSSQTDSTKPPKDTNTATQPHS